MEAWEKVWLNERAWYQEQMDATPGVFSALCQMDCLDGMDPAEFRAWWGRVYGEADR